MGQLRTSDLVMVCLEKLCSTHIHFIACQFSLILPPQQDLSLIFRKFHLLSPGIQLVHDYLILTVVFLRSQALA